ncbi:MAG: hypothetical protein IKE65_03345 [Clostridia bacterium]|nr:hypothetical protein [Clostridia bacterium]
MNRDTANRTLSAAAPRYVTSDATKRAYAALKKAYSDKSGYGKSIRTNIQKLNDMGDFDPNKSAYYQSAYRSLKDAYHAQGKRDMENAAAKGAVNTEGHDNSYARTAANQAYLERLNELAAKVPELYSAAQSEFGNRKSELTGLIGLQQAAQQNDIDNARFALTTQQALDAARYDAAKYADSVNREKARLWWQSYLNI